MIAIVYFQFLMFFIYIYFVVRKHGVQKSISESWYVINPNLRWMFTVIFCYGLGVAQMFHGSVWFFLSGAFLCFVGAATTFKSGGPTVVVHNIGATGAIVFGLSGLVAVGVWWPWIPMVIGLLALLKAQNRTWWIECVAFFSILGGLIHKYL